MTKMFTKEEQLKFMENLDISPIERFLSEKLKIEIKFSKNIYEKDENIQMELTSQDLKEYAGILSSQYEYLKLITFGSCSFYIDRNDKINFAIPSIYYNFKHINDGMNCHEVQKFWYDFRLDQWSTRDSWKHEDKPYNFFINKNNEIVKVQH